MSIFNYRIQAEKKLGDKLSEQLKSELTVNEDELFEFAEFNAEEAERGGYSDYSY